MSSDTERPPQRLSLPDIGALRIKKEDISRFMSLIEARGGGNDLYTMADRIQAATAVQSALAVQATYDILRDSSLELTSIEDLQKLIQSINRASATVNSSLRHMGLVGSNREDEADSDPLSQFLATIDLSKHCPPEIKKEFIAAEDDAKRTQEGTHKIPVGAVDIREVVNKIKRPVKTYTEVDVKPKENVISFGEEKVDSI
jgi:hypothetical protein